jgi:hypothetical protein
MRFEPRCREREQAPTTTRPRPQVDVLNNRGCCSMKRCGNIVKNCRNNVKDKNHVFNWNKSNVFNLVRSIISVMSLKKNMSIVVKYYFLYI